MTLNLNVPPTQPGMTPRIVVIGVGGAGGNAVNNMISSNLEGVEFVIANTDAQAITHSLCDNRIQLGRNVTGGLGAGSRPDVGRAAAEESLEEVLAQFEGANMVFIAAGMGGGTGTGAASVIARAARESGVLTVGVVTKPFQFEGIHRMRLAENGIRDLTQYVDSLIVIPNQNLFRLANEKTTFADAFKMADDVLYSGVRGVTDLMVKPGLINLDFADVRTVMSEMGKAMMGTGEAEGDNRAIAAAEAAISNPLLDEVSMRGARALLVNISGSDDLTLYELDEAANRIRDEVDPEANIVVGAAFDDTLKGRIRVSVVATGIETQEERQPKPVSLSVVEARAQNERPSRLAAGSPGAPAVARKTLGASAAAAAAVTSEALRESAEEPEEREASFAPAPEALTEEEPDVTAEERGEELPDTGSDLHDAFIPPQPAKPAARLPEARPVVAADPFAEAELANAAGVGSGGRVRPTAPRNRAYSLFARVTGAAKAVQQSMQGEPLPGAQDPRRDPQAGPRTAGRAGSDSRQPTLSGLDPNERIVASREEEDRLDIPAFLRRQAN